jgi:hypothetical protein
MFAVDVGRELPYRNCALAENRGPLCQSFDGDTFRGVAYILEPYDFCNGQGTIAGQFQKQHVGRVGTARCSLLGPDEMAAFMICLTAASTEMPESAVKGQTRVACELRVERFEASVVSMNLAAHNISRVTTM